MKRKVTKSLIGALAAASAICVLIATGLVMPQAIHASDQDKDNGGGFLAPLKAWQEKMSDAFRDTFQKLGVGQADQSSSAVSADFREQNDSYMLRLSLPQRTLSKVEVQLDGNKLRVVAPGEGSARHYEQTIILEGLPAGVTPHIERKQQDHLIVVTVPKSAAGLAPLRTPAPTGELGPVLRRDHDIMESMERMRRDMDRIFEDTFSGFSFMPSYRELFDRYRFSSTYEISEEGGDYVVRIYLPSRDMAKVDVKVDGQTLHIDAHAEESENRAESPTSSVKSYRAQYSQRVTLPGRVDAIKMKVDRKDQMLVITLPKAA